LLSAFIQELINNNPKKLFLYDGLGALLSAFLMGVVLVKLEWLTGIPKSSLYFLAFIPCLFFAFDFYNYRKDDGNISTPLRTIAILNLLYCCVSLAVAFYHFDVITSFGWIYIILEILIIVLVAGVELGVVRRLSQLT